MWNDLENEHFLSSSSAKKGPGSKEIEINVNCLKQLTQKIKTTNFNFLYPMPEHRSRLFDFKVETMPPIQWS